jgi:uncharacterized protein (DUF58 family)
MKTDRKFLDSAVIARLSRLQVLARKPMIGSVTGIHRSAHRGSSVEFAEYRKYVPGDDIRHLDWRVYARTDKFFMKDFEADTNLRCYLVLDASGSMAFSSHHGSKFDYAVRLAGTLAYLLAEQGDAVGLSYFAGDTVKEIPARRTPSHLKHIFDTMAEIQPSGKTQIIQLIHDMAEKIKRRAMVIIFSDLFTDVHQVLDCFQHMRFRKHDLAVFHILDRQELNFDFERPIRFVDLESPTSLLTDPAVIRRTYQELLTGFLKEIKRGCEEFNVDYQFVVTDSDYEAVLASFLLQRMRNKPQK